MHFEYRFPPITETKRPNGLNTIWLSDYEQPTLHLALQLPIGRLWDPQGLEGVSEILLGLMQKGSKAHPAGAFADTIEQLGASLTADLGEEHLTLGVRVLEKFADQIVPIFWEVISSPALEPKEFARIKKELLTALQAEYSDPSSLAGKHFQAELYGKGHPAGRAHTLRSIKKIRLADVATFYERYVSPHGATLVVAGARDIDSMRSSWEPLFDSWESSPTTGPAPNLPSVQLDTTRIRLVDRPDSTQTTLIVGHPTIGELHPKRNAVALGNYVLGGGNFSSRLMAHIRSKTGKTYGISSQLATNKRYGTWLVSTTTQNQQLSEVALSIFDVYREMSEKGISRNELEKAQQFAAGSMAFELEGIANVTEKLLWLRFYGRENSYIENYSRQLKILTLDRVNEAIGEYLNQGTFVIAAVGRRDTVEKQLEQFGTVHACNLRADP